MGISIYLIKVDISMIRRDCIDGPYVPVQVLVLGGLDAYMPMRGRGLESCPVFSR